jgi:hypothetical protein
MVPIGQVLSEKIKIKREGQTDDDDECKVMTKPHMILWVR